ncbi:Ribosomal protein L28e [Coniochaeta hoffmannii]|uniref:Ribosomal protein L28e n=1 Tax=Coniochaeta hoffmannii TaxID=91930 RepID=A0AA38RSF0_9PEZI|nr:Ribosomal protein L28e [Coniochaeta hoffmannii]
MSFPNISADVIWEVARNNNSFLVKRSKHIGGGGGVQFSRDPLNPTNIHSRKYAGFVNDKAVGVVPTEKGVQVVSKKAGSGNKPAASKYSVNYTKSTRKTFKSIANQTAKSGYRPDLRAAAVARASAIRRSQRPVKPSPEPKLRGNAAKKAAQA